MSLQKRVAGNGTTADLRARQALIRTILANQPKEWSEQESAKIEGKLPQFHLNELKKIKKLYQKIKPKK